MSLVADNSYVPNTSLATLTRPLFRLTKTGSFKIVVRTPLPAKAYLAKKTPDRCGGGWYIPMLDLVMHVIFCAWEVVLTAV